MSKLQNELRKFVSKIHTDEEWLVKAQNHPLMANSKDDLIKVWRSWKWMLQPQYADKWYRTHNFLGCICAYKMGVNVITTSQIG